MPRSLIAVIGDTHIDTSDEKWSLAVALGQRLVDDGYHIVTGGLGDLPVALADGARRSQRRDDGSLVAILPGFDPALARPQADIVIASGIDLARNMVVANSDAVVAIGGGAGTLSEIAFAWALKRLILAYEVSGWSGKLAGKRIDDRIRYPEIESDCIYPVRTDEEVSMKLKQLLPLYVRRHRGVTVKSEK